MRQCRFCGHKARNDQKGTTCPDCGNDLPPAMPVKPKLTKIFTAVILLVFFAFGFLYLFINKDKSESKKTTYTLHQQKESVPVIDEQQPGQSQKITSHKKIQQLEFIASQGDEVAQYDLAQAYEHGESVEQNVQEALRWYRMAADQGNLKARLCLGRIFEQGKDVKRNISEARRWYQLAAAAGSMEAKEALYRLDKKR